MEKILFITLVFILPLGELGRFDLGNGLAVSLNDALVGLLSLTFLLNILIFRKKVDLSLSKKIALFVLICLVSLLLNMRFLNLSQFSISFLYLLRWIAYAGLFFVVLNFNKSFKNKIPILMIVSGFAFVVIGFAQLYFYPALRNLIYLGWDEHFYRLFSSFLDPNFAGAFFVLNFVLVLGMFLNKLRKKKLGELGVLGGLGLLTLIAVLLTYSRSAFIMLFVCVIVFLLFKRMWRVLGISLVIFVVSIFILSMTFRSEGTNLLRTTSTLARLKSSENALTIFKNNPVLGVGFNSYRYAQKRYGLSDDDKNWEQNHGGAGTDNSFLFVLATTGVVGLIAYLLMWFKIFKKLNETFRESKSEYQISKSETIPNILKSKKQKEDSGQARMTIQQVQYTNKRLLRYARNDKKTGMLNPFNSIQGEQVQRETEFRRMMCLVTISSIAGIFVNSLFINSLFYPFIMEWLWILIALNYGNIKENI